MRLKLRTWILAASIAGVWGLLVLAWFVFPKNRYSNYLNTVSLAGIFSPSTSQGLSLKTYNASTPCPASTDTQIPNQGSGLCTGNLHFTVPLDNTALALIYNSNFNSAFMAPFAEDRGFGMGWQISRDERIVPSGDNLMTLITGAGNVVPFQPNGSNQWTADPRRTRTWLTLNPKTTTLYRNFPGGVNYSYQLYGKNFYLTAINSPTGQTVTISRDPNTSFITGVSDSFGTQVSLTCGASQCTEVKIFGGGGAYSFDYLNGVGLTGITSPDGYQTRFGYQAVDGANRVYHLVSSITDPRGNLTQFGYYTNGALASVIDPQNFSTQLIYSNHPQVNSVFYRDADGSREETLHPNTFNVLSSVTPIGTTTYEYDGYGRLASVMPPNTNDALGFTYDSKNPNNPFPIRVVDSYGLTTTISYSDYLYPLTVSVTGPSGTPMKTVYTYDQAFRVTSKMTDGIGYSYTYDSKGNLTKVANQAGVVVSSNTFDAQGQLIQTTDLFGVNQNFTYTKGNLATFQDEFGQVSSFGYNPLGQLTQASYPDGTSRTATYTPTGNPTGVTDSTYGTTLNTSLSVSLNNTSASTTYNGNTLSSTNSNQNQFGEESNSSALLPNGFISAGFMKMLTGAVSAASSTSVTTSAGGSCSRQPGAMKSAPTSNYNLNVSINGSQGGSGTVVSTDDSHKNDINCGSNCSAQYTSSQSITLTATPVAGATFTSWSGNQCSGSKNPTCTVQLSTTGDTNITANFQGTQSPYTLKVNIAGSGTVVSTPSGINCGTGTTNICQLQSNLQIALTATPASGYVFTSWSGCPGAVSSNTCSVPSTTTGTVTVTANFSNSGGISVTVAGSGTVTTQSGPASINCKNSGGPTCSATATGTYALKATSDPGYKFTKWTGACSGNGACSPMVSNGLVTVGAQFDSTNNYSLTVTNSPANAGWVSTEDGRMNCKTDSCVAYYSASGSTETLTASPLSDYTFAGWGGACSGKNLTCNVTITGSTKVSASWSKISSNTLKVLQSGGTGSISTSPSGITTCSSSPCTGTFAAGTQVTVTATPPNNYKISNWSGCASVTAQNACVVKVNSNPTTVTVSYISSSTTTTTTTMRVCGGNGQACCSGSKCNSGLKCYSGNSCKP